MGWKDFLGLGDVAAKVMEGTDKLFTSDDERLKAKEIIDKNLQDFMAGMEGQMTERWKADMASDSKLSKNIRPMTWAATSIVYFALLLISTIDTVPQYVLESAQYAWITITSAYVIMREAGKGVVNWKK